jgi:hypothetical protein
MAILPPQADEKIKQMQFMTRLSNGHPLSLGSVMYLDGLLLPQVWQYYLNIKYTGAIIHHGIKLVLTKIIYNQRALAQNKLCSSCKISEYHKWMYTGT